jgi:hypothetical protein
MNLMNCGDNKKESLANKTETENFQLYFFSSNQDFQNCEMHLMTSQAHTRFLGSRSCILTLSTFAPIIKSFILKPPEMEEKESRIVEAN